MTKAIFLDIDGTLVSFRTHRIPDSARKAISRARAAGIKIFIATGRPIPFIDNLEGMEYDGLVCTNGAYVVTDKGEVIDKRPICREDIARLARYSHGHKLPVVLASEDRIIASGMKTADEGIKEVFALVGLPVPEPSRIEDALGMDVLQIIGFFTREEEGHVMGDILPHCDAYRWHPAFADCIATGVNKATGIDAVCRHYGIALSETMAFGDGGNDIGMIRHAGIGVAMGNAADDVKAAADIVTTSVDDDGVARVIDSILK